MDKETAKKISNYLFDCGQHDKKFKLGDIIRYTPSEILELLEKMPELKTNLEVKMGKFVEICEILTRTKENTDIILNALEDADFSVCCIGSWGDDGADMYVMKKEDNSQ